MIMRKISLTLKPSDAYERCLETTITRAYILIRYNGASANLLYAVVGNVQNPLF